MRQRYKEFFKNTYKSFYDLPDNYSWFLMEGVINPEEYLKNIEKKINDFFKNIKRERNLHQLCSILNSKFFFNKIKFQEQDSIKNGIEQYIDFGINGAQTLPNTRATIFIFLNENVLHIFKNEKFYKDFLKWLLFVITQVC